MCNLARIIPILCLPPDNSVLGNLVVYIKSAGCIGEEEKFRLVFYFKNPAHDQERAISKGLELMAHPGTKEIMRNNRECFLKDKGDVTAFLVWFVENYPDSFHTMCENPDYQYRFK